MEPKNSKRSKFFKQKFNVSVRPPKPDGLDFRSGMEQKWTLVVGWNKRFFLMAQAIVLRLDLTIGLEWIGLQEWNGTKVDSSSGMEQTFFF